MRSLSAAGPVLQPSPVRRSFKLTAPGTRVEDPSEDEEEEEAASFALRAAIRGDSRWGLVVISLSEEESESGSANDGHFSWDSSEVKRV